MTNVYLIRCATTTYYKIGIADDPNKRLEALQAGCPYPLHIVMTCGFLSRTAASQAELDVHAKLAKHNVRGEWFNLSQDQITQLKFDMASCAE